MGPTLRQPKSIPFSAEFCPPSRNHIVRTIHLKERVGLFGLGNPTSVRGERLGVPWSQPGSEANQHLQHKNILLAVRIRIISQDTKQACPTGVSFLNANVINESQATVQGTWKGLSYLKDPKRAKMSEATPRLPVLRG